MAGRTFLDNLMLSAAGVSPFIRKAIGSVSEAVEPDPQVTNRMSMLPFGNYSDGSVGFAWPQSLVDSQAALQRFGSGQAPQPQADAGRLAQAVISPVSAFGSELIRAARNEFSGAEARDRGVQMPVANWPDGPGLAVPQAVYDLIDSGRQFNNAAEASRGIPHTAEESFPRDQDAVLAGAVMTGGLGMVRPASSLGTFGGRLAKTADHAKLAQAEELAARGAAREQIWNETGWFQGADGK
jgi:hypothetical protein